MQGWRGRIQLWVGLGGVLGLCLLVALLVFPVKRTFLGQTQTYILTAEFDHVGELKLQAPVKLAGVTVGRVQKISLDPKKLKAKVEVSVLSQYQQLPVKTKIAVRTVGLLGETYLALLIMEYGEIDGPFLKDGDRIPFTASFRSLEDLIDAYLAIQATQSPRRP